MARMLVESARSIMAETALLVWIEGGPTSGSLPSVIGPFPNAEVAVAFSKAFLDGNVETTRMTQLSTPQDAAKSMNQLVPH